VPKALGAFRAAIALEPAYAAAHAGLALAGCAQAQFRMAPFSDAYAEAKAAALRALAMDPSCAAAQTALGAVLFFSEWDWLAAERSLRRALDLDPEQTEAYLLYRQLLEALGNLESGLAVKRKALELEPRSPLVHFSISFSYWNQRRYERGNCMNREPSGARPFRRIRLERGCGWTVSGFSATRTKLVAMSVAGDLRTNSARLAPSCGDAVVADVRYGD
jgi:tetratricopeptide (TPR) repeat protein